MINLWLKNTFPILIIKITLRIGNISNLCHVARPFPPIMHPVLLR